MKMTEVDEPGLFLLGVELLDAAGNTLFETLERQLKPYFGHDWFAQTLVRSHEDKELAPGDLSALLVQIVVRNNSNFRLALRTEYNDGDALTKNYLDHLSDLRITRNEWFHRIIRPITTDELFDLCRTLVDVFPRRADITVTALKLLKILKSDTYTASDLLKISRYVGPYLSRLEEIESKLREQSQSDEVSLEIYIEEQRAIIEEIEKGESILGTFQTPYVASIGDPYVGSLLPQKYTLKLDGTIIDRRAGMDLKAKLGEKAIGIGKSLLKHHPSGGRLRISAQGTVVGYEDEEWTVIGSVDLDNWFDI